MHTNARDMQICKRSSYGPLRITYIRKSQSPIDVVILQPRRFAQRKCVRTLSRGEAMASQGSMASRNSRAPGRGRSMGTAVEAGRAATRTQSPELLSLYEQLLALRLDLVHGVMPRAERITLTSGDLEYLLVQLDAAIAATRDIVAVRG